MYDERSVTDLLQEQSNVLFKINKQTYYEDGVECYDEVHFRGRKAEN